MLMLKRDDTVEGKEIIFGSLIDDSNNFLYFRSYWSFRKHFPDHADQLYGSLDIATQRQVEKERDAGSNGTNSMSASLRGSNSSLNSMPGAVYSMCL